MMQNVLASLVTQRCLPVCQAFAGLCQQPSPAFQCLHDHEITGQRAKGTVE